MLYSWPNQTALLMYTIRFRDLLYTDYRSSTKQKIQRRREKLYSTGAEAEDNESGGARKDQKEARRMTDVEPLPLDDQSAEDPVNAEILRQCSFSFVTDETSQQSSAEYTPSLSRESHSYSGDSSSGYYSYYSYNENFSNHSYGASPYSYYPVPVPRAPSNITREGGPVHYPYYYPPRPYDANREGGHPYGRVHSWQTGSFDSYYSHESSGQATSAAPPPPPHPFWYG